MKIDIAEMPVTLFAKMLFEEWMRANKVNVNVIEQKIPVLSTANLVKNCTQMSL